MAHETQPAALERTAGEDTLQAYRVTAAQEIARLLAELIDAAAPVVLSGPGGSSFTTTLWSVDAAREHASFGADARDAGLQRLVDGGEIVAVAYLDHVKLQFDLHRPVLVHGAHASVVQARLPLVMYRFQRRGSFRVRTGPTRTPVLRVRHPSIPEMQLALRILDLSAGGCALLLPGDVPPLQPGTRLQRVRVELDAATHFDADVLLRHVSSSDERGAQRLGCEWHPLDSHAQCALQRYIDDTQRRQRPLWRG